MLMIASFKDLFSYWVSVTGIGCKILTMVSSIHGKECMGKITIFIYIRERTSEPIETVIMSRAYFYFNHIHLSQ